MALALGSRAGVAIQPDVDLAWIDRMSITCTGQPYHRRSPREVFTIEIERVGHSGSSGG